MNKRITIIALSGLLSLLTAGCADLTWQSPFDVGGNAADHTNRPQHLTATDPADIEIIDTAASDSVKVISVVTGDSCQTRVDQPVASRQQAVSFLREDAARFGAQAIVQLQCYSLPKTADSRCYTQVSCFAKAADFVND